MSNNIERPQEKFVDGWEGITKKEWAEMNNKISNQMPVWITISNGLGFDAKATLRANGWHPDKIPRIMLENYKAKELLKKISQEYSLSFY